MSTIYFIRNLVNGKIYIGSTCAAPAKRFNQHRSLLRRAKHPNAHLQAAWNTCGEQAFSFGVIEETTPADKLKREQFWLDHFQSYVRTLGYNLSTKASANHTGLRHSAETRALLSRLNTGRRFKGRPLTPERKKLLSAKIKGRHFHTPESRAKIAAAAKRPRSAAWRRSRSQNQRGKPRWSVEERKRIQAQMTGRIQTDATKLKRRQTLKKLFSTPEYKLKRSQWNKRAWITRRKATAKTTSKP